MGLIEVEDNNESESNFLEEEYSVFISLLKSSLGRTEIPFIENLKRSRDELKKIILVFKNPKLSESQKKAAILHLIMSYEGREHFPMFCLHPSLWDIDVDREMSSSITYLIVDIYKQIFIEELENYKIKNSSSVINILFKSKEINSENSELMNILLSNVLGSYYDQHPLYEIYPEGLNADLEDIVYEKKEEPMVHKEEDKMAKRAMNDTIKKFFLEDITQEALKNHPEYFLLMTDFDFFLKPESIAKFKAYYLDVMTFLLLVEPLAFLKIMPRFRHKRYTRNLWPMFFRSHKEVLQDEGSDLHYSIFNHLWASEDDLPDNLSKILNEGRQKVVNQKILTHQEVKNIVDTTGSVLEKKDEKLLYVDNFEPEKNKIEEILNYPAPIFMESESELSEKFSIKDFSFQLEDVPEEMEVIFIHTGKGPENSWQKVKLSGKKKFRLKARKYKVGHSYSIRFAYGKNHENQPNGADISSFDFIYNPKNLGENIQDLDDEEISENPETLEEITLKKGGNFSVEDMGHLNADEVQKVLEKKPEYIQQWQDELLGFFDIYESEGYVESIEKFEVKGDKCEIFFEEDLPCFQGESLGSIIINIHNFSFLKPQIESKFRGELLTSEILKPLVQLILEENTERNEKKKNRLDISVWRDAIDGRRERSMIMRRHTNFVPFSSYEQLENEKGEKFYFWDHFVSGKGSKAMLSDFRSFEKFLLNQGVVISMDVEKIKIGQKISSNRIKSMSFDLEEVGIQFSVEINNKAQKESDLFSFQFPKNISNQWKIECKHWAMGILSTLGLIVVENNMHLKILKDGVEKKFHLRKSGKNIRFSLEEASIDFKMGKKEKSSYEAIVSRFNNGTGRVKNESRKRGFQKSSTWTDFFEADETVYQDAYFQENPQKNEDSSDKYEILRSSVRWKKYVASRVLRAKFSDSVHTENLDLKSGRLKSELDKFIRSLSREEKKYFKDIETPTELLYFKIEGGISFIDGLIDHWERKKIPINVMESPVFKNFEEIMSFCIKNKIEVRALNEEDSDILSFYEGKGLRVEEIF